MSSREVVAYKVHGEWSQTFCGEEKMLDSAGVNPKIFDDAEVIALLRETQNEIAAYGESNELNILVRDFAMELVRRRVFAKVEFLRLMEPNKPE
jgi:hypothetical protein